MFYCVFLECSLFSQFNSRSPWKVCTGVLGCGSYQLNWTALCISTLEISGWLKRCVLIYIWFNKSSPPHRYLQSLPSVWVFLYLRKGDMQFRGRIISDSCFCPHVVSSLVFFHAHGIFPHTHTGRKMCPKLREKRPFHLLICSHVLGLTLWSKPHLWLWGTRDIVFEDKTHMIGVSEVWEDLKIDLEYLLLRLQRLNEVIWKTTQKQD